MLQLITSYSPKWHSSICGWSLTTCCITDSNRQCHERCSARSIAAFIMVWKTSVTPSLSVFACFFAGARSLLLPEMSLNSIWHPECTIRSKRNTLFTYKRSAQTNPKTKYTNIWLHKMKPTKLRLTTVRLVLTSKQPSRNTRRPRNWAHGNHCHKTTARWAALAHSLNIKSQFRCDVQATT